MKCQEKGSLNFTPELHSCLLLPSYPLWNTSLKTVKNLKLEIHFFKNIYFQKILKGRGDNLVLSIYIKETAINDSFLVHLQL